MESKLDMMINEDEKKKFGRNNFDFTDLIQNLPGSDDDKQYLK